MSTNKAMLSLLMVCSLALSSTLNESCNRVKEVLVPIPESLLVDPVSLKVLVLVRSLASGYVSNTSCIGQYRLLLIKQRKYREGVLKVYGNQ